MSQADANAVILHHYATSPFSEKVRLAFGLKRMRWRSVDVPRIMPKPDVIALTGGYRRTPFLQVGADIYCDSALACRIVDRLAPEPALYPAGVRGEAEIVAQWADASLFWTAIPFTLQPAGAPHIFGSAPAEFVKAFAADRAAMTTSMRRAPTADAGAALATYLERIDSMLADGRRFLLGSEPSIADVSVAHSIWFIRRAPPVLGQIRRSPRIDGWYERVAAFGHGEAQAMSSEAAIAVAASAEPKPARVADGQPFKAGDVVTVAAADYAHDEVEGRIVGLDVEEVVVARDDSRAGRVHVHFPRIGYHVKAVNAAV